MADDLNQTENKKLTIGSALVIVLIILVLLAVSWVLTKGVDDNAGQKAPANNTTQMTQNIPQEPSNPNVTGGTSGTGTGNSNGASTPTPSPAGGTDTNGQPSAY